MEVCRNDYLDSGPWLDNSYLTLRHSSRYSPSQHFGQTSIKIRSALNRSIVRNIWRARHSTDHGAGGKPASPQCPAEAVLPLFLGKDAEEFTLSDAHLLLGDFGEAYNPAVEVRQGRDCHMPLAMRPPEACFEPQATLSFSADIWSHATAIWETLGMKAIFSNNLTTADELFSQQIDVLGPMPQSWWEHWEKRDKFFDANGHPKGDRYVWPSIEHAFEEGIQSYRRKRWVGEYWRTEMVSIINLMRRMLAFRPEERPTAEDVLNSEWMVK